MIAPRPEEPAFYVVDRIIDRGARDLAIAGPFATSEPANEEKRLWRTRGRRGAMVRYAYPHEVELAPGGIQ